MSETDKAAHFLHLLDLLKIERIEDRKQYEDKIRNRSLEDRKKEGVTWYPIMISNSFLGTGEKWVLKCDKTTDLKQRHFFQAGASVSLFLHDPKKKLSTSGIISRIGDQSMTIVLNGDEPPDWLDEGRLGLDLLFDESTYDEMEKAMVKLSQVSSGRLMTLIPILLGRSEPQFEKALGIQHPGLNGSQNKALDLIVSAKDLALVHGPPGTGKTTTLVEAIKDTVQMERQVLVSASSNAAVDLVVERLSEHGLRVLRIGHPARVTERVISTTLDARLAEHDDAKMLRDLRKKSEELRTIGRKYKRHFGHSERQQRRLLLQEARNLKEEAQALEAYMIRDEIDRAEVVACTLVGVNASYLAGRTFKTLFIDEASQALEPANWIPIMKADRIIMAGDHCQLPPTVKSIEAGKLGLSQTIFERCMRREAASVMLDIQYRMHPDILSYPNKTFYSGMLKSDDVVYQRKAFFNPSVTFIDTAGCGFEEKLNEETLSTYNQEEGYFLIKYITDELLGDIRKEGLSLGIIAPYKAQVEILKNAVKDLQWPEEVMNLMTIYTVDAFQGQERDVIVISLVRSNAGQEIGFLKDVRRMNVAMTRARHLLVMIGDSATLSGFPFYDHMIRHFQEAGCYKSAFEFQDYL